MIDYLGTLFTCIAFFFIGLGIIGMCRARIPRKPADGENPDAAAEEDWNWGFVSLVAGIVVLLILLAHR